MTARKPRSRPLHGATTARAPLSQQTHGWPSVAGIGLESMLALQAVDEAAERDRAAHKRGTAMIAALTRLQRAMLAEEDPSLALDASE